MKIKSTGIVRRVDDIGRVVITKSLRFQYGINDGDPLEFFETDDGILIKKYRQAKEATDHAD